MAQPGTHVHDTWSGTSSTSSTFQSSATVVFDTDLPNGPYGDMNPMGAAMIHVPPESTNDEVAKAMLAAWIKQRGSMNQMTSVHTGPGGTQSGGQYTEQWRIISIEYKGGKVDPNAIANEGPHNVTLGIIQTTGPAMGPRNTPNHVLNSWSHVCRCTIFSNRRFRTISLVQ